jgi:hypothetical protein
MYNLSIIEQTIILFNVDIFLTRRRTNNILMWFRFENLHLKITTIFFFFIVSVRRTVYVYNSDRDIVLRLFPQYCMLFLYRILLKNVPKGDYFDFHQTT